MTWRRLWIIAVTAFVIGFIAFLPAHLFDDRINRSLPAPWHVATSGSAWNGFGVLQAGQNAAALTIPFTWKFDLLALARLHLAWRITPASPAISGSVKVGAGVQSIEFRDAELAIDASMLQHAIPLIAIFSPSGNLLVTTPKDAALTLGYGNDLHFNGDAHIRADNFGLLLYGLQPLGNYQLKFTAHDAVIDYIFTQSSGALKLDGGGSIQAAAPRQIAFAGHAIPAPVLPDILLAQIKAFGPPAADGRVRIDWKARW